AQHRDLVADQDRVGVGVLRRDGRDDLDVGGRQIDGGLARGTRSARSISGPTRTTRASAAARTANARPRRARPVPGRRRPAISVGRKEIARLVTAARSEQCDPTPQHRTHHTLTVDHRSYFLNSNSAHLAAFSLRSKLRRDFAPVTSRRLARNSTVTRCGDFRRTTLDASTPSVRSIPTVARETLPPVANALRAAQATPWPRDKPRSRTRRPSRTPSVAPALASAR